MQIGNLLHYLFFEGLLFFFSIIIVQWDSPRWNLGLLPIPLGKPAATLTLPGLLIKFQDQQVWNVNLFSPTACSSTQTVYMTRLYHCSILPRRPGRQLGWCMKVEWLSLWADRVLTTVGSGVSWPHFLSEWVGGWKRVCFSETDTRFGSDWFPCCDIYGRQVTEDERGWGWRRQMKYRMNSYLRCWSVS